MLAVDVDGLVGRDEVEMPTAGDHGDERQLSVLELPPVANREAEQLVVELQSTIDVAHPDGDVVQVRHLDHATTSAPVARSRRTGTR